MHATPPRRRHAAARGRRSGPKIQQVRVQAAGAALPCVAVEGHLRAGAPRERAAQLGAAREGFAAAQPSAAARAFRA